MRRPIMRFVRDLPIRRKLTLLVIVACAFALLLAGAGVLAYEIVAFRQTMVRDLTITARMVGDNCAVSLEFDDAKDADAILSTLSVHPHIVAACLYDRAGRPFAKFYRDGHTERYVPPPTEADGHRFHIDSLVLVEPVIVGEDRAGTIYLQSDLAELSVRFRSLALIGAGIFAASLVAGVLLAARLRTMIAAPILELASTAERIASEKNFALRARAHGEDELGHLIRGINSMLDQIQERDVQLEQARAELERRVDERAQELRVSRELHASLVEALPMNVFRKDLDGRFTFCNARFAAELHRQPEEVLGRTDFDFFPAELARQYRADDLVVMNSNRAFEAVESHQLPSGELTYVQVMKIPLTDGQGVSLGIQGMFWDVTDRRRAEEQLAHERDLLRALLDSSPDNIYFKDKQSRFIKCSRALATQFGLPNPDDIIGKSDFDFFTKEHADPAFEDEQAIMKSGKPILAKTERETWQSGAETWALTTKMPLKDRFGRTIGTFGVTRDITELKKAEAKLEATHKQLLQASRQAGMAEVATGVLHNVGNVLNSVNVSSTLIADNLRKSKTSTLPKIVALFREHEQDLGSFLTADPRGRQLPNFIAQLSDHILGEQASMLSEVGSLKKNIEHIRDIVAMQQNYAKMAGLSEQVKLADLVEDALHINAGALTRHDIQVERDFQDAPPVVVEKHKVLQILVNLIRNAKYACDEGRDQDKRLSIRVWNGDGRVHVQVADNGIGIPPENLTRIFGHGFTTRQEGHGFGLHSSALAAREMGGSLHAHSEGHGRGASFVLDLPLQPPAHNG